jgi:hypothetical protein
MGGCDFERDDVHALPDAVDVARIRRVPERCGMALVGLGGEEELEGDVGGRGRVVQESVGLVVWADVCAELAHLLLGLLEGVVLSRDICGGRRGCAVGCCVESGYGAVAFSVELCVYRLELLERIVYRRLN